MEENVFEPEEIDLRAYWETLKRRRYTIIGCLVVVVSLVAILTMLQPRKYQAETKILTSGTDRSSGSDVLSSTIPALGAFADQRHVQTQVEIIKSWPLLKEAAERAGLSPTDPRNIPVKVAGGKDDNVITITAVSTEREEAMRLADSVAAVYVDRNLQMNRGSAHAGRVFLEKQQVKLEEDLEKATKALRDYQERTGAVGLDAATENTVKVLTDLEGSRTTAESDQAAAAARAAQVRGALGSTSETITSSQSIARNPRIEALQDKIANLQVERAGLLKDFAPTSRRIQALDEQITLAQNQQGLAVAEIMSGRQISVNPVHQSLFTQLVDAEGQTLAASARVKGLQRAIARQQKDLLRLPEHQYRLANLQRDVQVTEKTYLAVQDRYQQLRIAEESTLANAQVIEPALKPEYPVSPKTKLNLVLAVLVGLMLGVGLAALQEALDDSITTPEDVEKEIGLPLLGVVGLIPEPEQRSLVRSGPFSAVAEAFRMIRSNIKFMAVDRELGTLMVTSASKGEGKSTTAANLAVTLAQDGRNVVLVDCDLRRPSVHKQFGLPNTFGLTNAIAGATPLAEIQHDVDVENLRVVTGGPIPPNPAELLDSSSFKRVLDELREHADVVVCDAPPMLGVVDASILAGQTDGVVIVTASGDVNRQAARRTVQMLQQARATPLGVVLNKTSRRSASYGEYYYYYHYGEDNAGGNGSSGGHSGGAPSRRTHAGSRKEN